MTWMAYELPTTRRSGGSTNVPIVMARPLSTSTPSVHTSAIITAASGRMTPRLVRNDSHRLTITTPRAMGVKNARSCRMSCTAACFTWDAPV